MGSLIIRPTYTNTLSLSGWPGLRDRALFHFWWWFNRIYNRTWFWLRIEGAENLPNDGPALLVSNHVGFLDASIISAASRRRVSFMIAREYYDMRIVHWFCEYLSCIPVNRSGEDIAAVKGTLKNLRKGMLVVVFPEGGLTEETGKGDAKMGVGLLALRSGVPVIPVFLGDYPLQSIARTALLPKRTFIRIGEPLEFAGEDYKNRESLARVTDTIWLAVQKLSEIQS